MFGTFSLHAFSPPNINIVSHGCAYKDDLKINDEVDDLLGKFWHNLNKNVIRLDQRKKLSYNWKSEKGNFFLRHFADTAIDEIDSRELCFCRGTCGTFFVGLYRSIFDDLDFTLEVAG